MYNILHVYIIYLTYKFCAPYNTNIIFNWIFGTACKQHTNNTYHSFHFISFYWWTLKASLRYSTYQKMIDTYFIFLRIILLQHPYSFTIVSMPIFIYIHFFLCVLLSFILLTLAVKSISVWCIINNNKFQRCFLFFCGPYSH